MNLYKRETIIIYSSTDISKRIKVYAKTNNISIKEMLNECDLSINTLANMNNGRMLLSSSLAKIADYLGCSVDYLIGRTNNPDIHR